MGTTEEETTGEVKVIEAEAEAKRTGEVMADTESGDQELQMKKAGACQVSMQGCPEDRDLTPKVQEMTMMMTTQTRNSVEMINFGNKCAFLLFIFSFEIYSKLEK